MNFAKLVKLAKWFANLAMGLRIWQWVANLAKWFAKFAKWFAKFAKWFAKFAMWFANFAMRNFAKLLAMGLRNAQYPAATVPLLTASYCFSSCLQLHLISSTFPLIFH